MAEIKLIKVTHQQSRLEFFEKQLDKATRSMNYHVKRKHHPDICAEYGEIASFYEWAVDKAKEPGWIPVSERLPEVGTGDVLVARSYKGKPYVDVGEFIAGTACCWGDEYAINPREHITTHWMPLPKPPKENADEVH